MPWPGASTSSWPRRSTGCRATRRTWPALFKRLSFAGIRIVTLAEGEIGELHVGLKGTMNALYLKDLADKTRRGLRGRVEAGASGGGNSYGYDVVHEPGPDGSVVRGGRRINPDEAAVVRRIFRDYAHGLSPKRIAYALNAEGVASPSGTAWGSSTLNGNAERGTGILNNELYIGRLVWNRLRYVKDPDTGKRVSRLNPPAQWVVQDVPDLASLTMELWQAVKARQRQVRHGTTGAADGLQPVWDRRRPRYLFSGLMRCGCCGGGYSKISENLFGCSTARNKGSTACTNRLNIRRDVRRGHRAERPEGAPDGAGAVQGVLRRVPQGTEPAAPGRGAERGAGPSGAGDGRAAHPKLVAALADGMPVRAVRDELVRLEAHQDELRRQLVRAPEPKPLLHPNLAEVYRARVAVLHRALGDGDARAEATDLIRSLVDEILLTPENGGLHIDLRGELAGILALCADKRKPDPVSGAGLAEQVKMVAGARNHRDLTLPPIIV